MLDPVRESLGQRLAPAEKGQGMVEYALIIVLVFMVVFVALTVLGPTIANIFNTAGNSMNY